MKPLLITLFSSFMLLPFNLVAQESQTSNFYDMLRIHFQEQKVNENNIQNRGDENKQEEKESDEYERAARIWGDRLYPHGDFNIAAKAMYDYAEKFNAQKELLSNASALTTANNVSWNCIGPTGIPSGSSSAKGNGQMHRITFDPFYNGTSNKVIYAASSYGGLWRSTDDGGYWNVVNTDYQLPFCTVADVAIDPTNSNNLFISTGEADGGFFLHTEPNRGNVNTLFTHGIYRSTNYGSTWSAINTGFFSGNYFQSGGTTRRLIINPLDKNQLFVATTKGIFRCNNSLATTPNWTMVFNGISTPDVEFRGLEFKPGSSSILYASGKDIYRSTDGGSNWISLSSSYGFSISALNSGNFKVARINIAVTPADSDRLYAYIIGTDGTAYIYMFKNNTWTQLQYLNGNCTPSRIPIAASPINANQVFFGNTNVYGKDDITQPGSFTDRSGYFNTGHHPDIHALAFQPNVANPNLFAGNDGGISLKDVSNVGTDGWQFKCNGLQTQMIWSFDQSKTEKGVYIIANQDAGVNVSVKNPDGSISWKIISGGDGYSAQIGRDEEGLMFYNYNSDLNFGRYDYNATPNTNIGEYSYIPNDPIATDANGNPVKEHLHATILIQNHPVTGQMVFGFNELFTRLKDVPDGSDNASTLWRLESDVSKNTNMEALWQRQLTEFAIAQSDPNYIYVVGPGFDYGESPGYTAISPRLFRSTTGGNNGDYSTNKFVDISSGLPDRDPTTPGTIDIPVITGIAVHPANATKLWLCFSGFDPAVKVWYSSDAGITWQNADPNQSLANLPVNNILYQEGSNDRLYIATDAGVYYKDNSMSSWERYGTNIPNVRVTELHTSPCSGKISASTYGRGVWEADLLPIDNIENTIPTIITSSTTWDAVKYLNSNLLIKSGATLTLTSTLNMPKDGKILIEPNAKLIIDGGKVTNNCDQHWGGIEVWGDRNKTQSATNQGTLELKNSATLEFARNAVSTSRVYSWGWDYNTTGGIIKADNAIFRNNYRDVEFLSYHRYTLNTPTVEVSNVSYFNKCKFTTDDTEADYSQKSHITMWDVNGVKIKGCTFEDIRIGMSDFFIPDNGRIGIFSINAGFVIDEFCPSGISSTHAPAPPGPTCNGNRSNFNNLYYGVQAFGLNNPVFSIKVKNSNFTCWNGVYLNDITNAQLNLNAFTANIYNEGSPNYLYPYGLYLEMCRNYNTEGNNFTSDTYYYGPYLWGGSAGIVAYNKHGNMEELYRSTFTNMVVGIEGLGKNKASDNYTGVKIKCNDYTNGKQDLFVLNDVYNPVSDPDQLGIANMQGFVQSGTTTTQNLAGNLFGNSSPILLNNIDNSGDYIYYAHHDPSSEPRVKPFKYTTSTVSLFGSNVPRTDQSCPNYLLPNYSNSIAASSTLTAQKELYKQGVEQLKTLVDGGNTQNLVDKVKQTQAQTAYVNYTDLLRISPYLSEKVLVELARNESGFTKAMVRDVMVSSTHAPKSALVQQTLDSRKDPLPIWMRSQIDAGKSRLSAYENQLMFIADVKYKHDMAINYSIHILLQDTLPKIDEIIRLLSNTEDAGFELRLADMYDALADIPKATQILNDLISNAELKDEERTSVNDYIDIRQLIYSWENSGENLAALLPSDLDKLRAFTSKPNLSSAKAMTLLKLNGALNYKERVYLPSGNTMVGSAMVADKTDQNPEETSAIQLKVFPNPSNQYFTLKYKLENKNDKAKFILLDILGKVIKEQSINNEEDELIIPVGSIPPGQYFCRLQSDKSISTTESITIIK